MQFETGRNTDLAVDTYAPSAEALGVAKNRAKEYWTKHQEQIGRDTRYLAIQSDSIFSDEIPDLYVKLINSPAVNSSDLENFGNDSELNMYCVNILACLRVDLYTTLNQSERAVAVCLDDLRSMGVEWQPHPTEEEGRREYERIWSQLGSRALRSLLNYP